VFSSLKQIIHVLLGVLPDSFHLEWLLIVVAFHLSQEIIIDSIEILIRSQVQTLNFHYQMLAPNALPEITRQFYHTKLLNAASQILSPLMNFFHNSEKLLGLLDNQKVIFIF